MHYVICNSHGLQLIMCVCVCLSLCVCVCVQVTDIFGSSVFTGPPNVLTRYAGAQASAVAFGRSYYYTQPGIALVDASTQANANK